MRSMVKSRGRQFSLGVALALCSVACNDLLGPDEDTVQVVEQRLCTPTGPCGTCSETASGGTTSTSYGYEGTTKACHVKTGLCDKTVYCTGKSDQCPNWFEPSSTACHTQADRCDKTVYCSGNSATCPSWFADTSTVCHTKTDDCDITVNCTGKSAACPNWFESSTTPCHAKTDLCDINAYCTGSAASCPSWFAGPTTTCQAASCSNGILQPARTCNGASASCPTNASVTCPSGTCDAAGIACGSTTPGAGGGSSQGGSGQGGTGTSIGGTINSTVPSSTGGTGIGTPTTELGSAGAGAGISCQQNEDCPPVFPHCAGGVCCNRACGGECESCSLEGKVGNCNLVPAGSQPRDGKAACTSDGTVCGGYCDGKLSSCNYPVGEPAGMASSGTCSAGIAALPFACNGTGKMPKARTQACGTFGCDSTGTVCNGTCASSPSACGATEYCSAGICLPRNAAGSPCAEHGECLTGICAEGLCCSGACKYPCESCSVSGHEGTCAPAPSAAFTSQCAGTEHAGAGSSSLLQGGAGSAGALSSRATSIPQAGTASAANPNGEDSGCGCRVPGTRNPSNTLFALFLGVLAFGTGLAQRRRQSSRHS
ncbi:MAG: MYXO-CTERM sorting domain-containing protein [Myxococcales bacterium]